MEKIRLPILKDDNPFAPEAERKDALPIEFKIAKAFLYQKYPLSEQGRILREKIVKLVDALRSNPDDKDAMRSLREMEDELPTVEHPHLELFKELEVGPEEEKEIFGPRLSVIQVTKGCRHQCEHCAADSGKDVQMMPYAMVLKIAEKKQGRDEDVVAMARQIEETIDKLLKNDGIRALTEKLDQTISEITKHDEELDRMTLRQREHYRLYLKEPLIDRWRMPCDFEAMKSSLFWLYEFEGEHDYDLPEGTSGCAKLLREFSDALQRRLSTEQAVKEFEASAYYGVSHSGDVEGIKDRLLEDILQWTDSCQITIHNYYDSDPFDYRDTAFLHEDGTPADYGDVVRVLASRERPVGIITAGYPSNDAVAQRAAEKITKMTKDKIMNLSISVHPYEIGTSQGDVERYGEDMQNVIRTLAPMKPLVTFVAGSGKNDEYREVEKELIRITASELDLHYRPSPVSSIGRGVRKAIKPGLNFDIMACMPGLHIWPNGSLHEQKKTGDRAVAQGSRPQDMDKKIIETK